MSIGLARTLGLGGIVGGVLLLLPFLPPGTAPDLGAARLILYNLGVIAVVVARDRGGAAVVPGLARFVATAAIAGNAWYLVMVVRAIGMERPFAGDDGMLFFFAGATMWLADAAFGFVTWRLAAIAGSGRFARWGAFALGIGSLLAFTGMDRLEWTTRADPTIFLPLSLAGIVLVGIGWIALGVDLVMTRRSSEAPPP